MSWRLALSLFAPGDRRPSREVEADIAEELAFHLELATEERCAEGQDPAEARRDAERAFGEFRRIYGACRREKLGDRIVLQRIGIVLLVVLVGAVVAQGVELRRSQAESQERLVEVSHQLEMLSLSLALGEPARGVRGTGGGLGPWTGGANTAGGPTPPGPAGPSPGAAGGPSTGAGYDPMNPREGDPAPEVFEEPDPGRALEEELKRQWAPELLEEVAAADGAMERFLKIDLLAQAIEGTDVDPEPRLQRGDRVSLFDPFERGELTGTYEVDDQGNLRLPEAGFLPVAGRTRAEVEVLVNHALSDFYTVQWGVMVSRDAWLLDPLLTILREDPDVFVRMRVVSLLEELADARAWRALGEAEQHDPEQSVREAAEGAREAIEARLQE